MGAWGSGTFENDDALDWLDQLEGDAAGAIEDAFTAVSGDYLEAPDASMILAAAEVVAAATGHPPADELPEAVATYLATKPDLTGMRAAAQGAVARVLAANSELDDLWKDSEDHAAWRGSVLDLQARLLR